MRAWVPAAAVAIVCAAPSVGRAASLNGQLSADRVEAGQSFQYQLSAMSGGGPTPDNPKLQVPPGVSVRGPSVSRNEQISFTNGQMQRNSGITATWTLIARKPGSYRIGPATVTVGGRTESAAPVSVQVVAPGTLPAPPPRRRRRWPFGGPDPFGGTDPFDDLDPFGILPRMRSMPHTDDFEDLLAPSAPEELQVDKAADPIAFLRATLTPKRAVVGQQQTLKIYAYGGRGPFQEINSAEPSRPDFLSHVIVENSYGQPTYRVPIDGHVFQAGLVREVALFPIKSGTLTIGSMRMGFRGRGYPTRAVHEGLIRESNPIQTEVSEPPLQGRPPGYQLGDVGRFSLEATVQPRAVTTGGSVSVVIKLSGTGNLPHKLHPPQRSEVEWLEPNITESITANRGVVGGFRQFSYVVRFTAPGAIDLGKITLPYYDADARRYRTARAELGTVQVASDPNAPVRPAAPVAAGPRLGDWLPVREEMGPPPEPPWHLADTSGFFWLLAAGPLSVLGAHGAALGWRRLRSRSAERRDSLGARAERALTEAKDALARGDQARALGLIERAVYTGLEKATGLKGRGVLRSELASELERAGLDATLAREATELLGRCDGARFASAAEDIEALLDHATTLVARSLRGRPGSSERRA